MKRLLLCAALACAVALPFNDAKASSGGATAAAILTGAVIGASAAAIIASAGRHEHHRVHRAYVPRRYRPGPYSPARGIVCYPGRLVCETNRGRYAPHWTHREYGR